MRSYRITKIIYAKDLETALKNEVQADLVEITLNETVEKPNTSIGFNK